MKRKIYILIIFLILAIIYLLYQQCTGKKPGVLPEKIQEQPVVTPPEKPPEKVEAPQEKPVVDLPRKHAVIAEKETARHVAKIEKRKPGPEEDMLPPEAAVEKLPEPPPVPTPDTEIAEDKADALLPEAAVEKLPETPPVPVPTADTEIAEDKAEISHPVKQEVVEPAPVISPEGRIALLPFDNFTDNRDALKQVAPLITSYLDTNGITVLSGHEIISFFCTERIRNISFITREQARKVREVLRVESILAGAVTSYASGENPGFGIAARLIDTSNGRIIWADYASETGNDYTGLLGLGTIKDIDKLVPRVMERLLSSFYSKPDQEDEESKYRVAVLPFSNISQYDDAGIIVTYLFLTELFRHRQFEPVEFGDVWGVIMDAKIRKRGELSHQNIETLSRSLGVGALLLGTVENYFVGIGEDNPPDITISARLLDARKNKMLWYNSRQLGGDDKIIVLDWGKLSSADKVAYSAVSDLVKNMESTQWR